MSNRSIVQELFGQRCARFSKRKKGLTTDQSLFLPGVGKGSITESALVSSGWNRL